MHQDAALTRGMYICVGWGGVVGRPGDAVIAATMTCAAFFIGRRRDDFKFTLDVCDRTRCVFLAETRNEIVLSIPRTLDVSPRVTPLACIVTLRTCFH